MEITIIDEQTGQCEFLLGRNVAYGTYDRSDGSYSVDHAPTQHDYDTIVAAMDAATKARNTI